MVASFGKFRHRLSTGDDAAAIVVDNDHADYQSDLALRLARQLRRDQNERRTPTFRLGVQSASAEGAFHRAACGKSPFRAMRSEPPA
jgi:hypothetical protein